MNYYEHHIGDYAEATSHLTFVEDAAYCRMLRKYYATERPLPADLKAVQRLIGARTKEEKAAVESVLKEFFDLRDDGWRNGRADEELARYEEKRKKARGSARARWDAHGSHSARTADAMRTHAGADANALPTQSEGNALQSPVSSLQSPVTREDTQSDTLTHDQDEAFQPTPAAAVCVSMRSVGLQTANPAHPGLLELLKAGASIDEFVDAAREAVTKGKSFPYALAIVRGRRKDASSIAEAAAANQANAAEALARQWEPLKRQARSSGFRDPWPVESPEVYETALKLHQRGAT